jgi:hypothetical protein
MDLSKVIGGAYANGYDLENICQNRNVTSSFLSDKE